MFLVDLVEAATHARERRGSLASFLDDPRTHGLRHWPKDVIEQWPYDHAGRVEFQADYGHIDLTTIAWAVEAISLEDLLAMPTGASEADLIDYFARDPEHWVALRDKGCHVGVREMWEVHGTWKRWPILLDRSLISPGETGLQVVEGRTRVGVLRGRVQRGLCVADHHLAWVGRARR